MSEARMWGYMRDHMPQYMHMERITEKLAGGIADTHWLCGGLAGWLELKYASVTEQKLDIRPDQVSWLMQYRRRTGRVAILVRVGQPKMWCLLEIGDTTRWADTVQGKNWYYLATEVWDERFFTMAFLVAALLRIEPVGETFSPTTSPG